MPNFSEEYSIFLCYFWQGRIVTQNVSWGVIISTRSLVLQRVARFHAGNYGCAAANDRGENQSSIVNLRIHCKYRLCPHCKWKFIQKIAIRFKTMIHFMLQFFVVMSSRKLVRKTFNLPFSRHKTWDNQSIIIAGLGKITPFSFIHVKFSSNFTV